MPAIWKKGVVIYLFNTVLMVCYFLGEQANRQHVASVNLDQLAKETEILARMLRKPTAKVILSDFFLSLDAHVTLDLARLIQKSRTNINMSQKDLAAVS